MNTENYNQTAAFLWSIVDLLRGDFKQSQYGRIILPFTLLRRLECVLEPSRQAVHQADQDNRDKVVGVRDKLLLRASGKTFYYTSPLTLATLSDTRTADDLMSYVQSLRCRGKTAGKHIFGR